VTAIIIIIIIQLFIIYVPSRQLESQLQAQHSVDAGNHIKEKQNLQAREKLCTSTIETKHIITEKVNKQKQR
jgi:hypothetical protein